MQETHTPLTRKSTSSGWQFAAQPQAKGVTWLLKDVRPLRSIGTASGVVHELCRGGELTDYYDGTIELRSGGQIITFNVDGTALCHDLNMRLRWQLKADGTDVEYWTDGAHTWHSWWATVIVYQG